MSSSSPTRRLAIAITAAVASTTIAVGVTAASLLGWFRPAPPASPAAPAEPAAAPTPVIFVPIAPAEPAVTPAPAAPVDEREADTQVAMHDHREHHDHDDHEDDDD